MKKLSTKGTSAAETTNQPVKRKLSPYLVVQAKLLRTRKQHAFMAGDKSLCGLAHIDECDGMRMVKVTTRLGLYIWPKADLNFCGRCRISLNAKGFI